MIIKCDVCKGQGVIGWEHLKLFHNKAKKEYKPCFRCRGKKYVIEKVLKNESKIG